MRLETRWALFYLTFVSRGCFDLSTDKINQVSFLERPDPEPMPWSITAMSASAVVGGIHCPGWRSFPFYPGNARCRSIRKHGIRPSDLSPALTKMGHAANKYVRRSGSSSRRGREGSFSRDLRAVRGRGSTVGWSVPRAKHGGVVYEAEERRNASTNSRDLASTPVVIPSSMRL